MPWPHTSRCLGHEGGDDCPQNGSHVGPDGVRLPESMIQIGKYYRWRRVAGMIALALLVCGCNWSSKAAVQVFQFLESPSAANVPARELQLPQFNPALGFLNSVTFDLHATGAFIQSFNLLGGAGAHRELSGEHDLTLTLTMPGYGDLLMLSQHAGHSPVGSSGLRVEPIRLSGNTVFSAPSGLAEFTGSGMVDLFFSARATHSGSGRVGLAAGLWAAGESLKVTYNYTAVPEQATWLAAVLASGVLAWTGRKHLVNRPHTQARTNQ